MKAKVAVFISGSGTNMAALLYASRLPDCPYEIVLVLSNNPDAGGLKLAAAEGIPTFVLPHKGMPARSMMRRWKRRSAATTRNGSRSRATCAS